jgi:hypothetical protein
MPEVGPSAISYSGDSKIATGDRRPNSSRNWLKMAEFRSPRRGIVCKVPEFRGFFPETGDRPNGGTGGLGREDSNSYMAKTITA